MKPLDKLMAKKKGEALDPTYSAAKMSMLQSLKDEMNGMMKGDLDGAKGMKHVEVAGDSPEALSEGLDKAKDMVGSEQDGEDEEGSEGAEDGGEVLEDMVKHEASEGDLTPEEIDALIQMLQDQKMKMGKY